MPSASIRLHAIRVVEIAAFAPILAALLLGSLPVLLALGLRHRLLPAAR